MDVARTRLTVLQELWSDGFVRPWMPLSREPEGVLPEWRLVTKRLPTPEELTGLCFAWEVVAAARLNAIAIVRDETLVGLGSGETRRVDAVDDALMKSRRAAPGTNCVVPCSRVTGSSPLPKASSILPRQVSPLSPSPVAGSVSPRSSQPARSGVW